MIKTPLGMLIVRVLGPRGTTSGGTNNGGTIDRLELHKILYNVDEKSGFFGNRDLDLVFKFTKDGNQLKTLEGL